MKKIKKWIVVILIAMFLTGITSEAVAGSSPGPAPNSGDGVSDGSGMGGQSGPSDGPGPAPNSGDGVSDGSGF